MKKNILLGFFIVLISSTGVFATDNESNPGSSFTVDATNQLRFSFSPKVAAQYLVSTAGVAGSQQWYAIGTYHDAGSLFYGTAADQTSVFKKKRTPGQGFEIAALPTSNEIEYEEDGKTVKYTPWVTLDEEGEVVTDDWYR